MVTWNLSFTIAYTDNTIKEIGIIQDDGGLRQTAGTAADLDTAMHLPKFVDFLSSIGITSTAILPTDIRNYTFRFSSITTNGHINVLGGTDTLDDQIITNDLNGVMADLLADPGFQQIFAQYPTPDYLWDSGNRNSLTLESSKVLHWFDSINGVDLNTYYPEFTGPEYKPTYISNALNNKPGLEFSNIINYLTNIDNMADINNYCTIFIVTNNISCPDEMCVLFEFINAGEEADGIFVSYIPSEPVVILAYINGGHIEIGTYCLKSLIDPSIIVIRQNNIRADLWVNGGISIPCTSSCPSSNFIAIGLPYGEGPFGTGFNGNIMSMAIFNTALSVEDIDRYQNHLSSIYNLSTPSVVEGPFEE